MLCSLKRAVICHYHLTVLEANLWSILWRLLSTKVLSDISLKTLPLYVTVINECNRYLRKEKEIAVAKCDVVLADNDRLTTKKKFLEKRLDECEQMLRELQEKEQVSLATAGQHAELMRRVELLNVLTDGNRVLRDEKMELTKKVQEMETKVLCYDLLLIIALVTGPNYFTRLLLLSNV